ncbi:MAG: DNA polymerase III subunit delta' [Myxococcales bacterium]|nr:DNA polymerase III subunit delta' [Myxococcales bacterium]
MNGLDGILGQDQAIARLRGAIASGRPHHAYLFDGPDGVGKLTTALALAQAWACERRPGEGCGACEPCRKIDQGIHPDVIRFEVLLEDGTKKGLTDRVRALIPRLAYAPNEARVRVVILDPADELNLEAANSLLKTLEEPPPRTHFILITAITSSLLPTIRSRCQRVQFRALDDAMIARRLTEGHGVAADLAVSAATLAGGSLGRALELASSEDLPKRRERAARLLVAAGGAKAFEVLQAAAEVAGDRDEADATLELLWITFRDAILLAEGLGEGRVAAQRREPAERLARRPATRLIAGLHAVEEARSAIRGFVSPQLAVEQLLLRLGQTGAA